MKNDLFGIPSLAHNGCLGEKYGVTDTQQDEDYHVAWERHKELTDAGYGHIDKGFHDKKSSLLICKNFNYEKGSQTI